MVTVWEYSPQSVAGASTAGEVERLAELQRNGTISDAEFHQAKATLPA